MTKTNLTAADIMRADVVTISPSMTLEAAYVKLTEQSISGAPVVNESGEVVGVISRSDLLRRSYRSEFEDFPTDIYYVGLPFAETLSSQEITEQARSTHVEEVMSTNVISVHPADPVHAIANKMRELHVHRVIVLENGMLRGILTSHDLLELLEQH